MERPIGFDCNNHIWIHHLNPAAINSFHDYHKSHPWKSSKFVQNNGIVNVNNTGCSKKNGLPPFWASHLRSLKILNGPSMKEAFFEEESIDFSKSATPSCTI